MIKCVRYYCELELMYRQQIVWVKWFEYFPLWLLYRSWKFHTFSLISRDYLKNHCTNTRLVCTYLNAVFFMLNPTMAMKNLDFNFCWKSCKIFACHLHSTSTWRGLIFRCWWNAAICWFIVNIHYCYLMWNGLQLYVVNISLCHLVLHFLSLQLKRTALHLASLSGHNKVCQLLLQAGADVQATTKVSAII